MRTIKSARWGTLYEFGPFAFLVRTRDNTAGVEFMLGPVALYYGVLQGRPVLQLEVLA